MVFIALIAIVAPITVQYSCVSTNINSFTGFIRCVLHLLARTYQSCPILQLTTQYCSLLIYTACQYITVPCLLATTTSAFCSFSKFEYYSLLFCIVNNGISRVLNQPFTADFCTYSILTITALFSLTEGKWKEIGRWDMADARLG